MLPDRHPPAVQALYDELNDAWLAFHKTSLRRDLCIALFIVGLVLSHWAMIPAGCIMGLGLISGRIAYCSAKEHRADVAMIEQRLEQARRT